MIFSNPIQHKKYVELYNKHMLKSIEPFINELKDNKAERVYIDIDLKEKIDIMDFTYNTTYLDVHRNKLYGVSSFKALQEIYLKMTPSIYLHDDSFHNHSIYCHSLYVTCTEPTVDDSSSDDSSLPELIYNSETSSENGDFIGSNNILSALLKYKQMNNIGTNHVPKHYCFNDSDNDSGCDNEIITNNSIINTDNIYQINYASDNLTMENNLNIDISDNTL